MTWRIDFDVAAKKELAKPDRQAQKFLLKYLRERIAPNNPRDYGEPLRKNLAGLWKYRVGDYRLVADILDEIVLSLILLVGHRRKVYGGH